MSGDDTTHKFRNEREVLDEIASGKMSAEDGATQLAERRRWNKRRVHMRTNRGLVVCQNLFGPRGPNSLTFSKAQWEKHVRFVNSGTMERFFESNTEYLYDRDRDGDYSSSKFSKRVPRNTFTEEKSRFNEADE